MLIKIKPQIVIIKHEEHMWLARLCVIMVI